jgi:Gpi18-like mannosyltransferase
MFKNISEIKKQWIILISMLYVAFVFLMHKWGHQGDMEFWIDWSKYIFNHGFTNVYDNPECNYLPAYLYVLRFHAKIQGSLQDIQDNMYTIKYYTFIFDVAGAYLAVWFVKDNTKKLFYFLMLMFNVAYIYNTTLWGQVDAIFTFFGFAAIVLAIEKKTIFSALSLLIALNFKLQALVFIPIVGLILLPQLFSKEGLKKIVIAVLIGVCLQIIILWPFIISGRVYQVLNVITTSVDKYPYPAVGAFNLWTLLLFNRTIEGMYDITDAVKFGFLTYKQIGSILFFLATFLAVFPLIKHLYLKYFKQGKSTFALSKIFLIAALVAMNFYFLNTQMHERYFHPAMISLAAYAFYSGRFFPFILASIAYFINLERICWYLAMHNDVYMKSFFMDSRFVAALYLVLFFMMFYSLYSKMETSKNDIELDI